MQRSDKIVGNDFIRHFPVVHQTGHPALQDVQYPFHTVLWTARGWPGGLSTGMDSANPGNHLAGGGSCRYYTNDSSLSSGKLGCHCADPCANLFINWVLRLEGNGWKRKITTHSTNTLRTLHNIVIMPFRIINCWATREPERECDHGTT